MYSLNVDYHLYQLGLNGHWDGKDEQKSNYSCNRCLNCTHKVHTTVIVTYLLVAVVVKEQHRFYSTQVYLRLLYVKRYCFKICRTRPPQLLLYCVYIVNYLSCV